MMDKKVLLIDAQVFQTMAWHRGMGKYSYELLKISATKLKKKYSRVELILNDKTKLEDDALEALSKLFGKDAMTYLDLVEARSTKSLSLAKEHNKRVLNDYVDTVKSQRIDYIILCLFLDNAPEFPDVAYKYLLFYDSIPFLFADKYKDRINFDHYLEHYKTVFKADKIFTISQTVADDLAVYFGISEDIMTNIDGAFIKNHDEHLSRPSTIDETTKFILAPTGDELRKNNLRAAQAFELFNATSGGQYKLVYTSFFSEYTKEQLQKISNNVVFTGNVPVDELSWLYKNAELVLFPSEYEGLGLPILEAVNAKKKIACSDIPVFREISKDAFFYFDPKSPDEMARSLKSALLVKDNKWLEPYSSIEKKYTWYHTAVAFVNGLESVTIKIPDFKKPKIAILCPDASGYSAIGKVVAESHYQLTQLYEIDYYFERGPEHRYLRPDYLSKVADSLNVEDFNSTEYRKYEFVIYHIGNSEYHLLTMLNALRFPGIVILHDTHLTRAYEELYELGYMSKDRFKSELQLDALWGVKKGNFLSSIVNAQLGIIVHSKYAKEAVLEVSRGVTVTESQLPTTTPMLSYHGGDVKNNQLKIGMAGIIAGVKGIELVEGIAMSEIATEASLYMFGYVQSPELRRRVESIPGMNLVPNPSDFEFQSLLSRMDILLNYRMKYNGETSLTVVEALRYGVVVIVRDVGWYSELPDDVVVKVKNKQEAVEKLKELTKNPELRTRISNSAKEYAKTKHSEKAYAINIKEVSQKVLAESSSINNMLTRSIKNDLGKSKALNLLKKAI